MDVREKLVELVDKARRYAANKCHSFMSCAECDHYGEHDGNCRNTYIAESLIADGVTVQECGHWEDDHGDYVCSCCHTVFTDDLVWLVRGESNKPNYCPHCGAKMMPQPPKGE